MPTVYFIVPSFYGGAGLKRTLAALRAYAGSDYALLVNEQRGGPTRVPIGCGVLFNGMIESALHDRRCRLVWTVADDAVPQPGAVDAVHRAMEADPTIGAASPREVGPGEEDSGGEGLGELVTPALNCCCVRREAWETVGPLDESYELGYYHDIDWGIRCWRSGFRVVQVGSAAFLHERAATYTRMHAEGLFDADTLPYRAAERAKERWPFLWKMGDDEMLGMLRRERLALGRGPRLVAAPVVRPEQVLAMGMLWNECHSCFTQGSGPIGGASEQLRWWSGESGPTRAFLYYCPDEPGAPVGFGYVRCREDGTFWVSGGLAEGWRGRGLGVPLFRHLSSLQQETWLEVREDNAAARRVYDRLGFVSVPGDGGAGRLTMRRV